MTSTAVLTRLGSIDTDTFLRDYWQQQPCLFRGAFDQTLAVASPDQLAGMACEEEIESRLLISDPDSGQFELLNGPFAEQKFSQLPDSHWSLLIQGVDLWLPEAADLLERFRFIPSWRLDDLMVSYSTQGGGVGPHYDNYDVFIIQVDGQRRWEIGGHYLERETEFLPGQPVRIIKHWQPLQSWDLEPGDMIYIPPRVGHNGIALSDDCINYSVGYRAQHAAEMLQHFAGYCADHDPDELRYSDPNLTIRPHSGEIQSDDLQQVKTLLQQLLDDPDKLQRWWGEYVTEPKHSDPERQQHNSASTATNPLALQQHLSQSNRIRRAEGIRFAFSRTGDEVRLFVDGHGYPLPASQLPLAQLLCDQNNYDAQQFSAYIKPPQTQALLLALFNLEHLYCD